MGCFASARLFPLPFLGVWCIGLTAPPLSSGQAAQEPRIRDSAGVRIVTHGLAAGQPAPFYIGATHSLDLGGLRETPSEELDSRNPFLVGKSLLDGRWVVVDFHQLRMFDRLGKHIRTIGQRGQGPGEFRQIRDVCVTAGDTIIAMGFSDRRVGVFDSAGKHIRTITVDGTIGAEPCFADGSMLVRGVPIPRPVPPGARASASPLDMVSLVDRVRWTGQVMQSLGHLQVEPPDLMFGAQGSMVVSGGRIHVGNGSEPEFQVYDATGTLKQIVRWRATPVAITPAMRQGMLDRGYLAGPAQRSHLPHYSALRVGPDGSVWIQDYPMPLRMPKGYTVFAAGGELLGRVDMPPLSGGRVDIAWLGTGRALLAWRDGDGMPHLTLHPIVGR